MLTFNKHGTHIMSNEKH